MSTFLPLCNIHFLLICVRHRLNFDVTALDGRLSLYRFESTAAENVHLLLKLMNIMVDKTKGGS
jgi:hypothetical protein